MFCKLSGFLTWKMWTFNSMMKSLESCFGFFYCFCVISIDLWSFYETIFRSILSRIKLTLAIWWLFKTFILWKKIFKKINKYLRFDINLFYFTCYNNCQIIVWRFISRKDFAEILFKIQKNGGGGHFLRGASRPIFRCITHTEIRGLRFLVCVVVPLLLYAIFTIGVVCVGK